METLIGYGSPNKANTHGVHGAPLGSDETSLTREQLKWKYGEFEIPDEVSHSCCGSVCGALVWMCAMATHLQGRLDRRLLPCLKGCWLSALPASLPAAGALRKCEPGAVPRLIC